MPAAASADPALDGHDQQLASLASRARLRIRRVRLGPGWWQRDSGPLIGFRKADGRPVALLPMRWGGYELADDTGASEALSPAQAETLTPYGYAVYSSFPPRQMSLADVLRFSASRLRADVLLLLMAGLAASGIVAALAVAGGTLVDTVLPKDEGSVFVAFGVALLTSTVALGLVEAVRALALVRVAGRMRLVLQGAVWDRLLTAPAPFFRLYPTAELAGRASGVDVLEQLVAGPAVAAAVSLLTSVASWAVLIGIDWRLAIVSAAIAAVFVAITATVHVRTHRDRRRLLALHGDMASMVFQLLNGVAKLRTAAAEQRAFNVWRTTFVEQHRVAALIERRNLLLQTVSVASPTVILVAALAMLAGNATRMSLGEFTVFSAALTVVLSAMVQATFAAPSFLHAMTVFDRARPILDQAPEAGAAARFPPRFRGRVELTGVSFRYGPTGPLVLDDVTLHAEPGEFVAIVGPSGSGKSTLLRLLLGFEQATNGSVAYDGHDLAELDVSAVRRQLGVVLQDARLLPGATLFENIAGSRRCTLDDVWSAATMAGLADDIRKMPMGMHTFVAEGAATFSGGQRQRLLIARAIVSHPGVLLLDEATSALDNRVQEQVTTSVEQLRITRIVIAHRLTTVARADRIYVIDGGRIVQRGTFDELMAVEGRFRDLALPQLA